MRSCCHNSGGRIPFHLSAGFDKYQRQLIHQLRELNIPIRVCEAGEAPVAGRGAAGDLPLHGGTKNTNDRSMVVHIRYGERSILFTADIGLTAQRDLVREYAGQFKSDILKLPHHGVGGISPDLLDVVSPELCFVSNGPTSHDVKLQKTAVLKRNLPLYFTSRQPLVLLTDGEIWEAQQWPADSLMLPWYQYQPEQSEK
ncbi:MAG: ComEC/Rec2 family competence protein [Lachnospiraceae bacterium]